jgi:polyphosphate kinase 2
LRALKYKSKIWERGIYRKKKKTYYLRFEKAPVERPWPKMRRGNPSGNIGRNPVAQNKAVQKAAAQTGAARNWPPKKAGHKKAVKKLAPATPESLEEAARKQEKKRIKAQKKAEKKNLKNKLKDKKNAAKALAGAFPMVELIDEQVRTAIPPELVAKVKEAKSKRHIISSNYPYPKQMKNSEYLEEVELLQIELVKMQAWVKETGERIVMIFEGRDAAGKGGTIQRFTENLNPRGAKVVALAKPSDTERGQWYFQRYIEMLPTKGEIVFFDRSWYNRAGVEHVMGFCSPHEYLEFMRQTPEFERMMVRSGIRFYKFWFSVSREEQLRRFLGRAQDPLKQWKLSPMDVESLGRWEAYTKAKEAMLFYTDTADAPWTIVRSDDKNRARLNAMKYVLHTIPYAGKDEDVVSAPDSHIVGSAKAIYERGENSHSHGPANHLPLSQDVSEHSKTLAPAAH